MLLEVEDVRTKLELWQESKHASEEHDCNFSSWFVVFTIETQILYKIVVGASASGCCLCILTASLYISQLGSSILDLYRKLNTVNARFMRRSERQLYLSLKTHFSLRLSLKEIREGLNNHDEHFVLGFVDGYGPAITRFKIIKLTFETLCNTILIMKVVNAI